MQPPRHVPGLDTLRGLSVVLVVMHHVAIRLPLRKSTVAEWLPDRLLAALNWNGGEAVQLFFVLSGFLIATSTLDRDGSPAGVRPAPFWGRRLARIGPPLVALVAVLSAFHLAGVKHYVIEGADQSLGGAVASAFGLYLNWYEGHTGYLPGGWDILWSLSIEEVFYLAFPVVLLVTRRTWVLGLGMAGFAATLPVTHGLAQGDIWREKAYLPSMSAIAAGVAAAVVARSLPPAPWRDRGVLVAGAVLVGSALGWGDRWFAALGAGALLVNVVGAALVAIGAYGLRAEAPWRVTAPLRSFGRWSYEIYLTHMFVVFGTVEVFAAAGLGKPQGGWAYPVALAGSWALGWAVARWGSEPANRAVRARLGLEQGASAPARGHAG